MDQHVSHDPRYYQTRNLALEIWQQIFREASLIPDVSEFTTDPGSYVRMRWHASNSNVETALLDEEELDAALEVRRNIVLVCKTWYAMGVGILYSHMRISQSLLDEMECYNIFSINPALKPFTRRLTINPSTHEPASTNHYWKRSHRISWLFLSLPSLQILEAPGEFLSLIPLKDLAKSLEVVIFSREPFIDPDPFSHRLPSAWNNVRVMEFYIGDLEFCMDRTQTVTFFSLEELSIKHEGETDDYEFVQYMSDNWTLPKLHTLSLEQLSWSALTKFLLRHAGTLKVMSLTTDGRWRFDPTERWDVELPNMQALYADCYMQLPDFIAPNLTRVGIHGVGFPENDNLDDVLSEYLSTLLWTFNLWLRYPEATSYCITGLDEVTIWLSEHPDVVKNIEELGERGIKVEWIHLDDDSYYK
jgi:hypothetical protein